MKLLAELQKQVNGMGRLRRAWFTSFNADIEFIETHVLPATIGVNPPRNRLEYEQMQQELSSNGIDFRVFCDPRFIETNRIKRTCIPVHGVRPVLSADYFSDNSLFHPKVIYLEDVNNKRIIGAGSANLTVSGWGRNLEAFTFFEIGSAVNYRRIQDFFSRLCDATGIESLPERFGRGSKADHWRFVHSYQDQTFPEQLLEGAKDADLAVWSPYLPRDLPAFVDGLHLAGNAERLRVHLVPDRIEGKYLRTEWSAALADMLSSGRLTAYRNRAPRHEQTELCHAKLWKLDGKLAIGSWNFTGPGANSLRDAHGAWSADNNVEAGFIVDDDHGWREACGDVLGLGADDCASPSLLDEESLVVAPLPPFDLQVSFDWHEHAYAFDGQWMGNGARDNYTVQLPGVEGRVPLEWKSGQPSRPPAALAVDDRALLRDRVFTVFCADQPVHQGLVLEKNVRSRRAQAFDTLQDLLEAFVHDDDPASLPDLPYRTTFDDDPLTIPADPAADPVAAVDGDQAGAAGVSYFRLFHAMQTYRQKLSGLARLEQLDNHVFSWPGCLQELIDKMQAEMGKPGREMFNWFLANEVDWLCACAQARRRSLVRGHREREPGYEPIPPARWRKLGVTVPAPPAGVHADYIELIRKQWHDE